MNINTEKTFDNFIVGKSNEFAFKVCKTVVDKFKGNSNCLTPIYIFGNHGLGKTHLLNAMCNEIDNNNSDAKVVYVTAEELFNEYLSALTSRNMDDFNKKYKNDTDVLLIDDIQFLSGKATMQDELFHIINTFIENNKPIVLTADIAPSNISNIKYSLYSRIVSGLVAEITYPEFEMKYKIVKNTVKKFNLNIPEKTIEYIANKITFNMAQLQGVTNSICAKYNFCKEDPTIELAEKVINEL